MNARVAHAPHASPASIAFGKLASNLAPSRRQPSPNRTNDQLRATARHGAMTLAAVQSDSSISATAKHAMNKMAALLNSVSLGGSSLLGMSAQIALQDAKDGNERVASGKTRVKEHFADAKAQTNRKFKLFKKRLDALRNSGFLEKFLTVLKVIGAVAGAGLAAITGTPLGIAAAVAIATSLALSFSSNDVAQHLSIGLGIAALGAGAVDAFVGSASKVLGVVAQAAKAGCLTFKTGSEVDSAVVMGIKASVDGEAIDLQASESDAETAAAKARKDASKETEAIQDAMTRTSKSLEMLQSLITAEHNAQLAAIQPSASTGGQR